MKPLTVSIVVAGALIGGAFLLSGSSRGVDTVGSVDNVTVVDGRQVIEIYAKGGYQPKKTIAKAGIPTVLRFDTSGTFDCSASVRVPSKNINQILPQSGTTDIDIGTNQAGVLRGSCGMGMYPFEVDFQA